MVSGRIRLADGSITLLCTRRISLVSALAAAVLAVGLDAADHHLDGEHHPHIRAMALARTWASVGIASGLGNAAGIRMRGRGCWDYCVSPFYTTCDHTRKPLKYSPLDGILL